MDRDRLIEVNSELEEQVDLYESLCSSYMETDSLKSEQINLLMEDSKRCYTIIAEQTKRINRLTTVNKWITVGGISIGVSLLLLLIYR